MTTKVVLDKRSHQILAKIGLGHETARLFSGGIKCDRLLPWSGFLEFSLLILLKSLVDSIDRLRGFD